MKLPALHRVFAVALFLLAGSARAQQMAITFDDLPSHGDKPSQISRLEITRAILATLRNEHMPPTYGFINAVRVEEDPQTISSLEAWRAAGQPLGNHSWSHPDLDTTALAAYLADIAKDEPILAHLAPTNPDGQDWHWFRYPFLHEGDTLEKHRGVRAWLKEHHYQIAEVTMDFGDYRWNTPYTRCVAKGDTASIQTLHDTYLAAADASIPVYRGMAQQLYGRDIKYVLLMHVGVFDAKMLPELLALYRSRGFSFVSLPEAIADPAYAEDPDLARKGGGSLLDYQLTKKGLTRAPTTHTGPRPQPPEAMCQ